MSDKHEFDIIDNHASREKRRVTKVLFAQLNETQRQKFLGIYPYGVAGILDVELREAYDLLKRTTLEMEAGS